jgi:trans-aconitate methyltransferase
VSRPVDGTDQVAAWGLPRVLAFFESHRHTTDELYPSERFFVDPRMRPGISVLDIGCAVGGFADMLAEHLDRYSYTGIDVNANMIDRARTRRPELEFHHIVKNDFSPLGGRRFDLVLALGFLHLTTHWRQTLIDAWRHTGDALVFDLRETHRATVEDTAISFFRMNFNGGGREYEEATLPYNILNSSDAVSAVIESCPDARNISHYGYLHQVGAAAVTPVDRVMANVYCVER